jgi:cellobiose phosphorylase
VSLLQGKYGYFSDDQMSYVITEWRTPKPWINVISNGRWGLTVSQTGGGYSWLTHAMLNRITRWNQDMIEDDYGKYVFLRDNVTGEKWSLTPQPLKPAYDEFRCIHSLGYTTFEAVFQGIRTELCIFVPQDIDCEVWRIKVENKSDEPRELTMTTYLELLLGVFPDWHREFNKTFIRTRYEKDLNAIIAENTLWTAPLPNNAGWNKSWDFNAYFFSSESPDSYECDRARFLGQYNDLRDADALSGKAHPDGKVSSRGLSNRTGTGFDPIISYQFDLKLAPGETRTIICCLGALATKKEQLAIAFKNVVKQVTQNSEGLLEEVKAHWLDISERLKVSTPEPALDVMVNCWLKYQTISCRMSGRSAYYQCGGAFGFRDQLQDSLIYLTLDPDRTRAQILMHAQHQQQDGTVEHWWHPISEEGRLTDISDDLLWLPFVAFKYMNETGRYDLLDELAAYLDGGAGTIFEHMRRAIDKVLLRRSPRGLALIGEGDWNDGLNGVGPAWKGESVWLSHFLYGVLNDFVALCETVGRPGSFIHHYREEAANLKKAILQHAFIGDWFMRATTDGGERLGSADNSEGKIFLNAQTWAIISGVVSGQGLIDNAETDGAQAGAPQADAIMEQVEKYLYRDYGVLLFTPAYTKVRKEIGYLTRYAPGVRENGGVYSHAAEWAIIAQAMAGRQSKVYDTFTRLCPPLLANRDQGRYKGEPYVTAGNVEGPESLHEGQGAWTWYSGSAAWLYNATIEYVLGVRVEKGKLVVKPNLPEGWPGFTMTRLFRGKKYRITVTLRKSTRDQYDVKIE